MPISPAPPSAANTSSSAGEVIYVTDPNLPVGWVEHSETHHGPRPHSPVMGFVPAQPSLRGLTKREHVASRNRLNFAVRRPQQQLARIINCLEAPYHLPIRKPYAHRLPNPYSAAKPWRPEPRKAWTARALSETALHRHGQLVEQRNGHHIAALGGEVRRRKFGPVRMMAALHTDADCGRNRVTLALDKNAGDLSPCAQQVVRPLQGQLRRERRHHRDCVIM